MALRRLVLAEVVGDPVAERDHPEDLLGAARLAGVEVLDGAAQVEQGLADLGGPAEAALVERLDRRLEQPVARLGGEADVVVAHACARRRPWPRTRATGPRPSAASRGRCRPWRRARAGPPRGPRAPSSARRSRRPAAVGAGAVRMNASPGGGSRGATCAGAAAWAAGWSVMWSGSFPRVPAASATRPKSLARRHERAAGRGRCTAGAHDTRLQRARRAYGHSTCRAPATGGRTRGFRRPADPFGPPVTPAKRATAARSQGRFRAAVAFVGHPHLSERVGLPAGSRIRWVSARAGSVASGGRSEAQPNCQDRLLRPNQKPSMTLLLSRPPDS